MKHEVFSKNGKKTRFLLGDCRLFGGSRPQNGIFFVSRRFFPTEDCRASRAKYFACSNVPNTVGNKFRALFSAAIDPRTLQRVLFSNSFWNPGSYCSISSLSIFPAVRMSHIDCNSLLCLPWAASGRHFLHRPTRLHSVLSFSNPLFSSYIA